MSLSFRYWIDPNYPSASTEDPSPDCSTRAKGSRIRNCLKKARLLVSAGSSFLVMSLFRRGKATKSVSPAGETDESFKNQALPRTDVVRTETQRFSFSFDFPVSCSSSSGPSSAADEDSISTSSSLPLASLFYFDDMSSPSGGREEETEFFNYYLNKVYKEPEAIMASFSDGRLAEWNRLLAGSMKVEEVRRDYRYGGRRTPSLCFSLHVHE